MKKYWLIACLFLAACQPADEGPKPAPGANQSQTDKPTDTPLPLSLIMTVATDTGLPNQIAVATKGVTSIERVFAFQTDMIYQYVIATDLKGANCLDSAAVAYFYAAQPSGARILPVNSAFNLKQNEPYQLKVRLENIHCDSIDLRFAFRRAK